MDDVRLGAILVRSGVISTEALDATLRNPSALKLGDRLVLAGHCTRHDIDAALLEQSELTSRLGFILVKQGALRSEDLMTVLEAHGPGRLGDRLLASGLCTRQQIDEALREQARLTSCLGQILIRAGLISALQLSDAIEYADAHGSRLGEALVALGLVAENTVQWALVVQKAIRAGAPAACLIASLVAGDASAAGVQVQARATVLPMQTVAVTVEAPSGAAATRVGLGSEAPFSMMLIGPNDGRSYILHRDDGPLAFKIFVETPMGRTELRPGLSVPGGPSAKIFIEMPDGSVAGVRALENRFTFVFNQS